MRKELIFTTLLWLTLLCYSNAQTKTWYDSAQIRIDTLRKGTFTFKVVDNEGNGMQDSIKIIHKKHEFPWGTAIDLNFNGGNNYTSAQPIIAPSDSEVYRTERWAANLTYNLPSVKSKNYKLTIKLSENFFTSVNSRLFDVYIDGTRVIKNLDKFAIAKGQYKAHDTTINVTAVGNSIKLEFTATKDNVAIMGIVLSDDLDNAILRLNCSGKDITTKKGNLYLNDINYLDKSSPNDNWVKSVMLKYCNYGVCGNQFKWSGIEPNHLQLNYAPFENTLSWFNKVGWNMRAHTVLWGGNNSTDYHCIPQWVMSLSSNPKAMYDTCKMRVFRELTRYKGIVKEYDVLNEPTHANYLQSIVGDSINWNCFKWAHEADPDARLFINDYNIIEWQDQTDNFVTLVKRMLQHGAPISGIGSQCHIGSSVDIPNFKKRFDQLGQFGLPVKITEFDMGAKSLTQVQHATEVSKMMRLAFSHPAIEGFIFWGLTEPTWVPASIINIIQEDKTARIAADSVYHLIHEVWSTKINTLSEPSGTCTFKGYYGDYDILVKAGGTWKKFNISCKKADKNTIAVLKEGEGIATSPTLKKAVIKSPTTIELTFNKSMADPSAEIRNYAVFDTVSNSIQSAALKTGDSATIVLKTKTSLLTKNYIPFSYYPGNQSSADGGLLEPFGPVYMKGYASAYLSARTSKDGRRIFVSFNKKLTDTTVRASEFSLKANNVNNPVTQAILNSTKDTLYLTPGKRIVKSSDAITVTYQPGSLVTNDGFFVNGFSGKSVINSLTVPLFVSAATSNDGKTISVAFNGQLADTSLHVSNFMVNVNSVNNAVTQAMLGVNKDTVRLILAGQIVKSSDVITVTYQSGSLLSSDSLFITNFNSKPVTNLVVVPAFVSAATSSDGITIQLTFSQLIADPSGQESAFGVTVNAKNNQVTNAKLLTNNHTIVSLSLSSGIYSSDSVFVAYNPGILISAIGVPLPAFSSKVTNNSINPHTGTENLNGRQIDCFPNPFADQLFISPAKEYESVTISDMYGKKIIQSLLNQNEITTINTSKLASGVYTVTLSNNSSHIVVKILKL